MDVGGQSAGLDTVLRRCACPMFLCAEKSAKLIGLGFVWGLVQIMPIIQFSK